MIPTSPLCTKSQITLSDRPERFIKLTFDCDIFSGQEVYSLHIQVNKFAHTFLLNAQGWKVKAMYEWLICQPLEAIESFYLCNPKPESHRMTLARECVQKMGQELSVVRAIAEIEAYIQQRRSA